MGFSQADFQALNLDRIRFGTRSTRPPPVQLSFLPPLEKPTKPPTQGRTTPPEEPGYDVKYQRRLW